MARLRPNVKTDNRSSWLEPLLEWCSRHPKTMLWLIFIAHVNLLLNIIGVFQ